MAFGKTILYQDFNSVGTGNNRYFAEDINDFIMAMQGNYTVSGCLAAVGGTTDLTSAGTHVTIASGVAFVNGAKRTIAAANIDLSTPFAALGTGESRLILAYINSSGVVATISGDIVTDGNQLPEASSTGWTPVDTTPLAWFYLTEADNVMSANQIRDEIIYSPKGGYFGGGDIHLEDNDSIYLGDSNDLQLYHDGTNGILNIITGGYYLGTESFLSLDLKTFVRVRDKDDGYVELFNLDTSARTLAIGANADEIVTTVYGSLVIDNLADAFLTFKEGGIESWYVYNKSTDSSLIIYNKSANKEALSIDNSENVYIPNGYLKNAIDNAGFYTGAGDDIRMYHDGTSSYIKNITGGLYIENEASAWTTSIRVGAQFRIEDRDDSYVKLFELDTDARTMTIGAAVDNIATTHYGDFTVDGTITSSTGGLIAETEVNIKTAPNTAVLKGVDAATDYLHVYIGSSSFGVELAASGGAWTSHSDIRYKSNISSPSVLAKMLKIETIEYDMYGNMEHEGEYDHRIGVDAQELRKYFPMLVKGNEEFEKLSVDYTHMSALMFTAFRETDDKMNILEERIAKIEAKN